MPVVIDIELITGRYDAAGAGDRSAAEWPPHPARVFCALVASARSDVDRNALRWLENLNAPIVEAAPTAESDTRASYVVTNSVETKGGSQFHPARTNALKVRRTTVPRSARLRMVWPEAHADESTIAVLDMLARRVPYLGRSTGVVAVSVHVVGRETTDDLPDGLERFEPAAGGRRQLSLRVPFSGYLDLLIDQHDNGRPAWEVSREVGYRQVDRGVSRSEPITTTPPSVYTDVIVLRFTGVRPDGRLTASFTQALRRAVMSATADPLPEALHGHDADGRPHVAFLALPNADNPRADGRLMGMAVAIPELPEAERRAIVRGVLVGLRTGNDVERAGERLLRFTVPRIGEVDLSYRPGLVRPWGIRPERWRRGSDQWTSVTPVVLDRYPSKGNVEQEITRSCLKVGLPAPREVVVSKSPLISGGVRMLPRDLPERARGKLFCHVRLRFDRDVPGPLLLGAGRYLGVGLMAPIHDDPAATVVAS